MVLGLGLDLGLDLDLGLGLGPHMGLRLRRRQVLGLGLCACRHCGQRAAGLSKPGEVVLRDGWPQPRAAHESIKGLEGLLSCLPMPGPVPVPMPMPMARAHSLTASLGAKVQCSSARSSAPRESTRRCERGL